MKAHNHQYSQIISWIKVILILVALGLLFSLFMLSGNIESKKSGLIPHIDLRQRAQEQGVLNPVFAGVTKKEYHIKLRATYAHPVNDDMQHFKAQNVNADIKTPSGRIININSNSADVMQQHFIATLIENVVITTETGYRLTTELLETRFDTIFAESPVPIAGTGPIGDIESDRMVLISDEATGDAQLLFKGDVKVTYKPRNTGEGTATGVRR
jgi:lipopolysaccharide export system protein LptC